MPDESERRVVIVCTRTFSCPLDRVLVALKRTKILCGTSMMDFILIYVVFLLLDGFVENSDLS
jgi:hypothetical protein